MMNELISVLVSAMIGAMPVIPAPDVVVPYSNLESTVEQYIEETEDYQVAVSCGEDDLVLPSSGDQKISCEVTNTESHETFSADINLHVVDTKVKVSAIILAEEAASSH